MNNCYRCSENTPLGTSATKQCAGGPITGGGASGCWLLPGAMSTVTALCQSLPLGTKPTAHKNVPKMEEAINMAPSDYTAWEGIESYY